MEAAAVENYPGRRQQEHSQNEPNIVRSRTGMEEPQAAQYKPGSNCREHRLSDTPGGWRPKSLGCLKGLTPNQQQRTGNGHGSDTSPPADKSSWGINFGG